MEYPLLKCRKGRRVEEERIQTIQAHLRRKSHGWEKKRERLAEDDDECHSVSCNPN